MNQHTSSNQSKQTMDIVTLGERGQIVVPAAMREQVGLAAGDKLMVFTKHDEMICLVPARSMRRLVDILTQQLADIEITDHLKEELK